MWEEKRSKQLSKGVRLWEGVGEAGGEEERRGLFDPGIHLAFMVWRRLSSPLNFVFRWREPERWEGDCGAGLRSPRTPPHLGGTCVGAEMGGGRLCPAGRDQQMPPHAVEKRSSTGMDISFVPNPFK